MSDDLDLPFEPIPDGAYLPDEHLHLSGGCVVMSATVPADNGSLLPALVFRFTDPNGTFYPPVVLVLSVAQLNKFPGLISDSIAAALRAAS